MPHVVRLSVVLFVCTILSCVAFTSFRVEAYGPHDFLSSGEARYLKDQDGNSGDSTHTVYYYPENVGGCGDWSNDEMLAMVSDVFQKIENASIGSVDVSKLKLVSRLNQMTNNSGAKVTYDITGSNYADVYVEDGDSGAKVTNEQTVVLFDSTGSITEAIHGPSAVCDTLGFGGAVFTSASSASYPKGQLVINCAPFTSACPDRDYSEDHLKAVMLHEFLHVLGLDHSQIGIDAVGTTSYSDDDEIATMFPTILGDATKRLSLNRDDIVGIASLYPSSSFESNFGMITGSVIDHEGHAIPCVEVVARNVDSDADTIASVTGYNAPTEGTGDFVDTCTNDCGDFKIKGLTPGGEYEITVRNIRKAYTGDSGIGRCRDGTQYDLDGDGAVEDKDEMTYRTHVTVDADESKSIEIETEALVDNDSGNDALETGMVNVCESSLNGQIPDSYPMGFMIFTFTLMGLLATGRRCVIRKHSSQPFVKLPKMPS